ncbi:hypothetical protein CEXT_387941 [Caerostris extrusa]|uniref:Uncharacterized protein n=1 Tax=Caerostris extrusa TaxID=172846 RepID=A0AAV4U870_CAEEX|nr:hypothetical protein CEXT_387941 [Caerostris extrusa]
MEEKKGERHKGIERRRISFLRLGIAEMNQLVLKCGFIRARKGKTAFCFSQNFNLAAVVVEGVEMDRKVLAARLGAFRGYQSLV